MKKKKNKKNFDTWKSTATSIQNEEIITVKDETFPVAAETEKDIPIKQVIVFFSVLVVIFTLSFALKYILPNVPEYVFERLLMIVLALFCIYMLWNVSAGFKHFIEKYLPKSIADRLNKCGNTMSNE